MLDLLIVSVISHDCVKEIKVVLLHLLTLKVMLFQVVLEDDLDTTETSKGMDTSLLLQRSLETLRSHGLFVVHLFYY